MIIERPIEVTRAVKLLIASSAIDLIAKIPTLLYLSSAEILSEIVISVLVYGVIGWFIYKIYQGRNWARIINLVLSIIGFVLIAPSFIYELNNDWLSACLIFFNVAVQAIALYLLFKSNSNVWFDSLEKPKLSEEFNQSK
jgi:hypothetical protein